MPRGPHRQRRSVRWCRCGWPLLIALLVPGASRAAAYLPGSQEPDPPTGDIASVSAAPSAAEPLAGSGIRWVIAPWRYGGSVALDLRLQRLDDGSRTRQSSLFGDIDFASHIWQPWFIQLRAGLGVLLASDHSNADGTLSGGTRNTSLTGRFGVSVFPASRFPFEVRGDVSDSRSHGDSLGSEYRSQRLSLSQGWRPEVGNTNLQFNLDHSRLIAADGVVDTLSTLQATAMHQWPGQSIDLGASFSRNERSDSVEHSVLTALNGRHSYHPAAELHVETLATYNETRLRSAVGDDVGSDVRQLSTLVSWRPRDGQWLYAPDAPLTVTGSARWVEAGSSGSNSGPGVRAFNGTLGVSKELSRVWRLGGSASVGHVEGGAAAAIDSANLSATVGWTPAALTLAQWQYAPTASLSASVARSSLAEMRKFASVQVAHSLSRSIALGEGNSLALSLSQSAAVLRESGSPEISKALAHSASLFWQSYDDAASQTVAGLTLSDSRTWAQASGSFQLVNVQLTRRTQLTRNSSWSANLTLQATRNDSSEIDAFTGQRQIEGPGWQQFHSGSLNYENQRVFGVPRLRFTVLLAANSQQLERRAIGDIDAPLERISRSLEARLDYSIGRLETRLSARNAQIDGRSVSALHARLQRRF